MNPDVVVKHGPDLAALIDAASQCCLADPTLPHDGDKSSLPCVSWIVQAVFDFHIFFIDTHQVVYVASTWRIPAYI
jgi:hypothetical protein